MNNSIRKLGTLVTIGQTAKPFKKAMSAALALVVLCGASAQGCDDGTGTSTGDGFAEPSGEYQVTINGFMATSATWDHALEVDGKGDEVYLSVGVQVLDEKGNPKQEIGGAEPVVTSAVMGDTNGWSGRVRAGSRSAQGGIQSGDRVPTATPWSRTGAAMPDRVPFVVMPRIKLSRGKDSHDSLVLSPSIWEWDGGSDAYEEWINWARDVLKKVPPGLGGGTLPAIVTAASEALDIAQLSRSIVGQAADRPIGISEQGSGSFKFDPKLVVLTYDSAEWLATGDRYGKGVGVVEIRYRDADRYRGDYTLYLQVQKV